jgi:hypothetical protein
MRTIFAYLSCPPRDNLPTIALQQHANAVTGAAAGTYHVRRPFPQVIMFTRSFHELNSGCRVLATLDKTIQASSPLVFAPKTFWLSCPSHSLVVVTLDNE